MPRPKLAPAVVTATRVAPAAHISVYAHARENTPGLAERFEWAELCDELEECANEFSEAPPGADAMAQKLTMRSFAPHRLAEGTTRANANVTAITALALDVDAGDPERVAAALRKRGWAAFLYESASSTPDAPRFRVVSPIVGELEPAECRATRLAFAEALELEPGCGVEECLDPSRVYFLGRLQGTTARRTWRVAGAPIAAAALPPPSPAWGAAKAPSVQLRPLESLPPGDAGIAAALGDWRLHEGRKFRLCGAIGGELRRHAFGPRKCEAVIREWLDGAEHEGVDVDEGVRWALGAWSKPANQVSGLAALAEVVGEEHARVIDGAMWAASFAGKASARREAGGARARFRPAGDDDESDPLGRIADLTKPIEPLRYLFRGLGIAWAGKVIGVHGYAGSSKGLFLSLLALGAASGKPVLGHSVAKPVPVLYLDAETGALAETRVKRLAAGLGIDLGELQRERWIQFRHVDRLLIDMLPAIEAEARALDHGDGVVIACDSYSSMTQGEEISSAYADALWQLGQLGNRIGAVPMVTLHERKQGREGKPTGPLEGISGTNRLAAALATSVRLTPSDENDREILVTCTRAPESRFEPFRMTWADGTGGELTAACEAARIATGRDKAQARDAAKEAKKHERIQKKADAIEVVLRTAQRPLTTRAARSSAALDNDGWSMAIAECLRRRTVRSEPGQNGLSWYAVPVEEVSVAGFTRTVPAKPAAPIDIKAAKARFKGLQSNRPKAR